VPTSLLVDSIVDLTCQLVRTPSEAERDSVAGMLAITRAWLQENHLSHQLLRTPDGREVGIQATLCGAHPGPLVCLDACLDTAPVGDRQSWTFDPFGASIEDGRLYGRGAADSKVAIALFLHLIRDLAQENAWQRGELHLLLDGDEHTGNFGGVRAYLKERDRLPSFVAIGYPGDTKIVRGARGFYRAVLRTTGTDAHSGGSRVDTSQNAVVKMAELIRRLSERTAPSSPESAFPLLPRWTVTAVHGGIGFSQIPGTCESNLDVRLTPRWDEAWARGQLIETLVQLDADHPTQRATVAEERESWPAYALPEDHPGLLALQRAASRVLGRSVGTAIAGPSNIGNFFARHGIPATCGFGVRYGNLHAANEWIALDSIAPAYQIYRDAVLSWAEELEPAFEPAT
jgi:succinyl-diaminopimelate desuccinylase